MTRRALLLAACAAACTERIDVGVADAGGIPGLVSLAVAPAEARLELADPSAPPMTAAFVATGTFVDGSVRDVTADVVWSIDNPRPVTMTAPGAVETTNMAGGRVVLSARAGAIEASAAIVVVLSAVVADPLFPPPGGAEDLFASPTSVITDDPAGVPVLRYPTDDTMFPPNVARALVQFDGGSGNDVFELRFESEYLHLAVYTTSTRWLPDSTVWRWIMDSNVGGQTVMTVSAVASALPGTVYRGPDTPLRIAAEPVDSPVSFWDDRDDAILTAPLGATSAAKLYPADPERKCAGCHAISRDGRRMALGYDGERLRIVDVATREIVVDTDVGVAMGGAAFSPDGTRLLVADDGTVTVIDAETGATLDTLPVPDGDGATHPDWSPDGTAVVVAVGTVPDNRTIRAGRIVRIPVVGAAWGTPEELVGSTGDGDTNFYPRYSPDGAWIAYVHAGEPSRNALSAELRLVPAGGGAPIVLTRANRHVGPSDDVEGVGNTMPSWAPRIDGGVAWLAFSSVRDYGSILAGVERDQIWISAIELARAEAGDDPSSPAFWFPPQDAMTMQHGPRWAVSPEVD